MWFGRGLYVCACICEREREKCRETWICVYVCVCVCVCVCVWDHNSRLLLPDISIYVTLVFWLNTNLWISKWKSASKTWISKGGDRKKDKKKERQRNRLIIWEEGTRIGRKMYIKIYWWDHYTLNENKLDCRLPLWLDSAPPPSFCSPLIFPQLYFISAWFPS